MALLRVKPLEIQFVASTGVTPVNEVYNEIDAEITSALDAAPNVHMFYMKTRFQSTLDDGPSTLFSAGSLSAPPLDADVGSTDQFREDQSNDLVGTAGCELVDAAGVKTFEEFSGVKRKGNQNPRNLGFVATLYYATAEALSGLIPQQTAVPKLNWANLQVNATNYASGILSLTINGGVAKNRICGIEVGKEGGGFREVMYTMNFSGHGNIQVNMPFVIS